MNVHKVLLEHTCTCSVVSLHHYHMHNVTCTLLYSVHVWAATSIISSLILRTAGKLYGILGI